MAATDVETAADEQTLYDLIVEESGIAYDEESYDDVEEYKNQIVRHFGKMDSEEFEKLADPLREWVNDATEIFNDNKKAKVKAALPAIDGLAEPEEAPRRGRRGRGADGEGGTRRRRRRGSGDGDDEAADKPAPQGRNPDASRYGRVMPYFMKDRQVEVEALQKAILRDHEVDYSDVTLERTLVACKGVIGWLERNGYDLTKE